MHGNEAVSEIRREPLYENFASYVGRERINGTVRVLFKTRLSEDASYFLPYKWPYCFTCHCLSRLETETE